MAKKSKETEFEKIKSLAMKLNKDSEYLFGKASGLRKRGKIDSSEYDPVKEAYKHTREALSMKLSGDSKRRGPAQIDVADAYKTAGHLWFKAGHSWPTNMRNSEAFVNAANYSKQISSKIHDYYAHPSEARGLERISYQSIFAVLSIVFFLASLFFISLSLTGAVIGPSVSSSYKNLLNIGLFVFGLVFALFFFREKGRNK